MKRFLLRLVVVVISCLAASCGKDIHYIIYFVPQWEMYIKLTESQNGKHYIIFSKNRNDINEGNNDELDYVCMDTSYDSGIWRYIVINKEKPDTLYVMSDKIHSLHVPMKTIGLRDYPITIEGKYFRCKEGYFGIGIYPEEEGIGVYLNDLPEENNNGKIESGWTLVEISRNCR